MLTAFLPQHSYIFAALVPSCGIIAFDIKLEIFTVLVAPARCVVIIRISIIEFDTLPAVEKPPRSCYTLRYNTIASRQVMLRWFDISCRCTPRDAVCPDGPLLYRSFDYPALNSGRLSYCV